MAVFSASTDKPVILRAGKAIVKVGDKNEPMIALGVTVQYSRQIEVVPVLGQNRVISIGEPQGTVQFDSVVAKSVDLTSAFGLNDEGCKPFKLTLTFEDSKCEDQAKRTITCHNGVASAVSITAQGGRGYIGEGINVTFTALEISDK